MNTRNPRRNQHGTVDVEIEHPEFGWIPFTASPDDPEPHGREIYARLLREEAEGKGIAAYEPPPPPPLAEREALARMERDRRLAATDWTQLEDVPVETWLIWRTYRGALRAVPEQPGFPDDITWPEPPTAADRGERSDPTGTTRPTRG